MMKKYFSEMFMEICMGIGVLTLCLMLWIMGILAMLSCTGVI